MVETLLTLKSCEPSDRIELRLVHSDLGEIDSRARFASELQPHANLNPNPLFMALKCFCDESQFRELLNHPWSVQKVSPEKKRLPQESVAFEEHVLWLLSVLGFSAIRLGVHERLGAPNSEFQRGSVDLLATKHNTGVVLVVGCTTGPPNAQDFTNLLAASQVLRNEAFSQTAVSVLPILVTAAQGLSETFPLFTHAVNIIDGQYLQHALELVGNGKDQEAAALFLRTAFSEITQ